MSCDHEPPTYRLLDGHVGWNPAVTKGDLVGLDDADGLRLKDPYDGRVPADVLSPYLPPPWLARGAAPCSWYLISVAPAPVLLQRDPCAAAQPWIKLADRAPGVAEVDAPDALAAWVPWLAAAAGKTQEVFVWSACDGRLIARFPAPAPGPLVFAPWGELLVVSEAKTLRRFSISGSERAPGIDLKSPIQRLGRGSDGAVYAALGAPEGPFEIWRVTLPRPAEPKKAIAPCNMTARLMSAPVAGRCWMQALPRTDLVSAEPERICLAEPGDDGALERRCFDRNGKIVSSAPNEPPEIAERTAELETAWLDSGIPRCRWHRVRVDAEIPDQAALRLRVVTSEESRVIDWTKDGEDLPLPDALLQQQPAGRYLKMRIQLVGQAASPVVHRVRLDYPRSTSLDLLPPVYRDNPVAEDFSERFLGLFDALRGDMDAAVAAFPQLWNSERAPAETLPWLAGMLGVSLDPAWGPQRVRKLLRALPRLYARRGTPAGLAEAIRLLFDLEPVLVEHAPSRPWGAIHSARLRGVRLFGANTARFRLGRSALDATALTTYGNPDLDPFRQVAHRVTILVPALPGRASDERSRLERLIQTQKPAHTSHSLRVGGAGFIVGAQAAVGIDTRFVPPAPAVLGRTAAPSAPGTAQLNARAALRSGCRRQAGGVQVGFSTVGSFTVLE